MHKSKFAETQQNLHESKLILCKLYSRHHPVLSEVVPICSYETENRVTCYMLNEYYKAPYFHMRLLRLPCFRLFKRLLNVTKSNYIQMMSSFTNAKIKGVYISLLVKMLY